MAKAPRWPHRQCVGHHLGKEPRQYRIPTKFPKHNNKEMTRKLYTDTVYYTPYMGQMTNCQWPIIKEQLVVCTKLIFILRHKFLKKLVVKPIFALFFGIRVDQLLLLLNYKFSGLWFCWTVTFTELPVLLSCQFCWIVTSTESLFLLWKAPQHAHWLLICKLLRHSQTR